MVHCDIAIVGAGMAGASLAAELAGAASVLILEAEDQPGYHATGRSAAFWSETYGGPYIQPLTTASGSFLREGDYLKPRGGLHIAAGAAGEAELVRMQQEFAGTVALARLERPELEARVPGLRPGWNAGLFEPSCMDIDVAALHAFYLAAARRGGAHLVTGARLTGAEAGKSGWSLATETGRFTAGIVVDAAGAWADQVAALAGIAPIGIQPYRRTLAQLRVSPPAAPALPLVVDALGRFYFKPEAGGRLWLSPHDESESEPCDCAPEEYDVALAVARLEKAVDWRVERVERRWAGLRSFAPDRLPVYGFAPGRRDFFWYAGQGGFGIQTAPAAAKLAAALLLGTAPDAGIAHIDPEPYSPARFAN
jgi:D-arginine dehydrogenase